MEKFTCPTCGEELIIGGSNMCNEMSSNYPEDDTAVCNNYSCANCGTYVEAYECSDEEKKDYPYWNNNK